MNFRNFSAQQKPYSSFGNLKEMRAQQNNNRVVGQYSPRFQKPTRSVEPVYMYEEEEEETENVPTVNSEETEVTENVPTGNSEEKKGGGRKRSRRKTRRNRKTRRR